MEVESEGASVAKRPRGGGGRGGRGGARGRARGRGGGRVGARGGGRGKKNAAPPQALQSDDDEEEGLAAAADGVAVDPPEESMDTQDENQPPPQIDLEADISQLEAPTFSTIDRGPPEPMLRLHWDHRVNLIGEKVLNPMIHCCDKCLKPILIYGRMIPCKHVFCLACAKKEDKVCPRCGEKVTRVEQTGLGTVFMCTHGGTRYGNTGCRRTYLSQRDLQAHINHRHLRGLPPQQLPPASTPSSDSHFPPNLSHKPPLLDLDKDRPSPTASLPPHAADPRTGGIQPHPHSHPPPHPHSHPPPPHPSYSRRSSGPIPPAPSPTTYQNAAPIPVMTSRTNLITVPIHDSASSASSSTSSSSSTTTAVGYYPSPPPPHPHAPPPHPPPYYSPSQPPPNYSAPQYYPYRGGGSNTNSASTPPQSQPPPGHPPYPPPVGGQWPPPSHHPHVHTHPPHPSYYR